MHKLFRTTLTSILRLLRKESNSRLRFNITRAPVIALLRTRRTLLPAKAKIPLRLRRATSRAPERRQTLSRGVDSSSSKDIQSLDRIFPGPRLACSLYGKRGYFLAFDRAKASSNNTRSYRSEPTEFPPKMKCWIQILSVPTADTPGTTVMLHFDQRRYLIGNVAEGTQRASVQRRLGLLKVGDIFLTGAVGWGTAGGVLGMILTVADASASSLREQAKALEERKAAASYREEIEQRPGKKSKDPGARQKKAAADAEQKPWLNIHGGKNLTHLLATARRFVFRKGMPLYTNEFRVKKNGQRNNWDPSYEDESVRVWDMVIEPEGRLVSPRKRSHDEFSDVEMESKDGTITESKEEVEDRHDQMRKSVVSSMFDSEWRLDALVAKKLSEVKLPAAIFIRDEEGKIQKYKGPMPNQGVEVPDVEVLVRNPWPGALIDELPPTTPSTTSVSYIFKNHPQRGKFNPKKAKELGVKAGPDYRILTLGQSVKAEDGTTVTPEMVLGPMKEGGGFAVIELPSSSYIEPLISREEWSSTEVMAGVVVVVWILGPGLIEDARLQDFMRKHAGLKHIVSSPECCPNYLALESPAAAAIRLNLIDPERFPIPKYCNNAVLQPDAQAPYQKAEPGLTIQLEPTIKFHEAEIISHLDTEKVVQEMPKEVLELAEIARKEITSVEYQEKLNKKQEDIPSKDAEVIALGTGSALPSKYRNVSATMIRVPGYGSYLLDCGENTLGQLKRVFGDELPEVLRDLKAIWISHLHADHHLGTSAVIKAWATETGIDSLTKQNKLLVVSHEGMTSWLKEYSLVENYGYDRLETINIAQSNERKFWSFRRDFDSEEVEKHGIASIEACPVEHCHGAAAVVLTFPNGFKVAYSGDCRPSRDFIKIGQGATLLVHEATFDDELLGDAIAKKHSTTSEALDVGKKMNARRILLTHFSQRYQKIPIMDSEGGKDQVAIVAFDYMRVKIGDFAKFEAFKPALMKLYEDENGDN
ncbi:hypothetical protein G7Y89_g3685 [Cudoniella acicularis]|uniref:ribonuclease Z n=1 Tax=Cudoniella acicularis TaxID=354080 RepID=A0A8H4W5D1_9HELO|nr:hypothetical protein G7Y89_g3685 [Cudoniella acicularis]